MSGMVKWIIDGAMAGELRGPSGYTRAVGFNEVLQKMDEDAAANAVVLLRTAVRLLEDHAEDADRTPREWEMARRAAAVALTQARDLVLAAWDVLDYWLLSSDGVEVVARDIAAFAARVMPLGAGNVYAVTPDGEMLFDGVSGFVTAIGALATEVEAAAEAAREDAEADGAEYCGTCDGVGTVKATDWRGPSHEHPGDDDPCRDCGGTGKEG
jgi:hypothetical protein